MSLLEASIDSQYFLENYEETNISISTSSNQYLLLEYDERGNYLNSGLIGTQMVYSCDTFTGITAGRYVMFHNSDNEILGMIKGTYDKKTGNIDNIRNNFYVKGQDVIYYKLNVGIENEEFSSNSVTFSDFTTEPIFKVILNGDETTAYTRVDNVITFDTGVYNSYGNQVFVIYYPSAQSLSGVSVSLQYYSPYKHEVTTNDELLLGTQLAGTVTVVSGSNSIATTSDLTSAIKEFDYIRIGTEIQQVMSITASVILTSEVFEDSYSGEDVYYLPYLLFANIESSTESPTAQYYTFQTKGVKQPIKIKQSVDNTFSFNYFIDEQMILDSCGIYRYASNDFDNHIPDNNKMRLIRAYYENDDVDKFVYLTNSRKLDPSKYNKGNYDKYDATLDFEEKLTLDMNKDWSTTDGILGSEGAGNFTLIRS